MTVYVNLVFVVAWYLGGCLIVVISLYHRAAILMNLCIACSTVRVGRTTWQCYTSYLPTMLVEKNKHRLDVCWYKLERLSHVDGLIGVLFL